MSHNNTQRRSLNVLPQDVLKDLESSLSFVVIQYLLLHHAN